MKLLPRIGLSLTTGFATILITLLMLWSPLVDAQSMPTPMPDTTATTMMLMSTAMNDTSSPAKHSKPPVDDGYVTDEVTMPDGSKAFLKHKKTATPPPAPKVSASVVADRPSMINDLSTNYNSHIFIYPVTVKGTPCVVASASTYGGTSVALSCGWKQ